MMVAVSETYSRGLAAIASPMMIYRYLYGCGKNISFAIAHAQSPAVEY
jgi:hypothetical protein